MVWGAMAWFGMVWYDMRGMYDAMCMHINPYVCRNFCTRVSLFLDGLIWCMILRWQTWLQSRFYSIFPWSSGRMYHVSNFRVPHAQTWNNKAFMIRNPSRFCYNWSGLWTILHKSRWFWPNRNQRKSQRSNCASTHPNNKKHPTCCELVLHVGGSFYTQWFCCWRFLFRQCRKSSPTSIALVLCHFFFQTCHVFCFLLQNLSHDGMMKNV